MRRASTSCPNGGHHGCEEGAIIEPAITDAVDVSHESVDANPREGTTAAQNAIDWNDPKRVRPDEAEFTGQGVDRAVYGKVQD